MSKLRTLPQPILSLDLKHNLIRVHKITLTILGNPEYIQLLVNPDDKSIVIMESISTDHLAHHVSYEKLKSGQSFELYSTILLENLKSISSQCNQKKMYRIYGKFHPNYKIVRFSINDVIAYNAERGIHE